MNTSYQLRLCILTGLLLTCVVGCNKPSEAERSSLEGHWTGFDLRQPDAQCSLSINGNLAEYRGTQPRDWLRGAFVLNEQAQPKQLDLKIEESGVSDAVGTTTLMIYELEGDELKVAASSRERPANFTDAERARLFSFKRE